MTREEIIQHVSHGGKYGSPTYLLTPEPDTLVICAELVNEGILIRMDSVTSTFRGGSSQYLFLLNTNEGKEVAFMDQEEHGR